MVCFPGARQAAQLERQIGQHRPETVWLLTSREPERMNAEQWLKFQRQYWGIESGLHQRLDVSGNEDRCRVRTRNAAWILGMFRRLAISLFMEWYMRTTKRKWMTLTDFFSEMSVNNQRRGFLLVSARQSSLRGAS
jgi:predicted transposase YbfD/YdcC